MLNMIDRVHVLIATLDYMIYCESRFDQLYVTVVTRIKPTIGDAILNHKSPTRIRVQSSDRYKDSQGDDQDDKSPRVCSL